MGLRDTINMMLSSDYKDRFKAEYYQTKYRADRLHNMLDELEAGTLSFKPTCPVVVLQEQERQMRNYLDILVIRAKIEGIEL